MKLFAAASFLIALLAVAPAGAAERVDCHVGSYRLGDGTAIDIAPSDGATLRWRFFNGETGQLHPQKNGTWSSTYGWTGQPDGKVVRFSACSKGAISFDGRVGKRIAFDVTNTTFESGGVKLVGRLVLPKGTGKVPIVVLVHGSETDSAIEYYALQRMFPAQGIGAFVYDKRGTGASGGTYTQNFQVLAADAVNALSEAKRLAGERAGRIGYQGGSEGGWVVPIAANRTHVDFAIVSFGLAVSIMQEDQESVALDMALHGWSADTEKALALARAGEHVIETGGREGYDAFDALRRKDKSEPWYKDVHGDFLFIVLPLDKQQILDAAARQYRFLADTPFHYDPMPALRASTTPQLWVLGGDDLDAPSAETAKRIRALIAQGKDYSLAVYPGAEHGMTDYELNAKGERLSTHYAPGYFRMMADFIRYGRIRQHYGNAAITLGEPPLR
jgi:pimeloyl-ACP methyl ester carboxylesterase